MTILFKRTVIISVPELVAKSALHLKYRLDIRARVGLLPKDGQIEAEMCSKGQR
jgi:hypothetical protein